MLKNRVIPILLLAERGLVKTMRFKDPKYVGDVTNAVRIFNDKEVDELIILDIDASRNGSKPNLAMIEELAGEAFVPITYGGGITSVRDAQSIFRLGIEKIALQTAVIERPALIRELSGAYGSSAVVVSLDIRKPSLRAPQLVYRNAGRKARYGWIEFMKIAQTMGAGELLIQSVDNDGMMTGLDLELIREAARHASVPLVAAGGTSSLNDIKLGIQAGADAVAAGAFFVYHGRHRAVLISYPEYGLLETLLNSQADTLGDYS